MVENAAQRGQRHLRESGYSAHKGGDIHTDAKADAAMVARGVHEHEANMHKGWPKTKLKLKGGGRVPGKKGAKRPDRRDRGGATDDDGFPPNPHNLLKFKPEGAPPPGPDPDGPPKDLMNRNVDPALRRVKPIRLLARGGSITADQPDDAQGNVGANSARARGGHVGKKGRTTVNINLGHGEQGNPAREQAAHQEGIKKGLMIGAAAHPPGPGALPTAPGGMPPHPPMGLPTGGPPGMGAPPMGGAPMMPPRPPMAGPPVGAPPGGMPPMMHKRGGAIERRDAEGRFTGGSI